MVDMKSLTAIIISISLLFFSAKAQGNELTETKGMILDIPRPIMLGENEMYSAGGLLWGGIQYLRFSLRKSEKLLHRSAVYHALNNAENGVITSWYSKKRMSAGQVRVIVSWPKSDGVCRVYQSYIKVNGTERHMTNRACKRLDNAWTFLK